MRRRMSTRCWMKFGVSIFLACTISSPSEATTALRGTMDGLPSQQRTGCSRLRLRTQQDAVRFRYLKRISNRACGRWNRTARIRSSIGIIGREKTGNEGRQEESLQFRPGVEVPSVRQKRKSKVNGCRGGANGDACSIPYFFRPN